MWKDRVEATKSTPGRGAQTQVAKERFGLKQHNHIRFTPTKAKPEQSGDAKPRIHLSLTGIADRRVTEELVE